jgi:hypothetical protein
VAGQPGTLGQGRAEHEIKNTIAARLLGMLSARELRTAAAPRGLAAVAWRWLAKWETLQLLVVR